MTYRLMVWADCINTYSIPGDKIDICNYTSIKFDPGPLCPSSRGPVSKPQDGDTLSPRLAEGEGVS